MTGNELAIAFVIAISIFALLMLLIMIIMDDY